MRKNLMQKVYEVLKNVPDARDNKGILYKEIWNEDKPFTDIKSVEWGLIPKDYSDPEYLGRLSRYWQEHDSSVRGKKWIQRQMKSGRIKRHQYDDPRQLKFDLGI